MSAIKELVRPVVTMALVTAFIWYANATENPAALVAGPMGIALGFWFKDREPQ